MASYSSAIRFIEPDREYRYACRVLNYYPMDLPAREELKDIAWENIKSDDLTTQVRGIRQLIRCQFDRSLEAAMEDGYWHNHPKNSVEYGRMMYYEDNPMIPRAALAAMRQIDGAYRPDHIRPGTSYWLGGR